ncbi:DNA-binding transcriptional regulator [Saccharospirillum sp. HFRX-1]|uniref:helix-turn-helix domain-containing protein n=1 Tax=unclassified Saccharospirillum TaxID=2633430 RepID=UPI003722E6F3
MADSILDVVHESARELHDAGLMDEMTMREFDALCLPPITQYSASQIKQIRTRSKASQAVFAAYLNTSRSTVQKWEQGVKKPNGAALKLLNLVDRKGLDVLL